MAIENLFLIIWWALWSQNAIFEFCNDKWLLFVSARTDPLTLDTETLWLLIGQATQAARHVTLSPTDEETVDFARVVRWLYSREESKWGESWRRVLRKTKGHLQQQTVTITNSHYCNVRDILAAVRSHALPPSRYILYLSIKLQVFTNYTHVF